MLLLTACTRHAGCTRYVQPLTQNSSEPRRKVPKRLRVSRTTQRSLLRLMNCWLIGVPGAFAAFGKSRLCHHDANERDDEKPDLKCVTALHSHTIT
jgi:hypothetical protein